VPEDLLHLMEKTLENRAMDISVEQALDLVQVFSPYASSYTLEIFDRIIGTNVDDLSSE